MTFQIKGCKRGQILESRDPVCRQWTFESVTALMYLVIRVHRVDVMALMYFVIRLSMVDSRNIMVL